MSESKHDPGPWRWSRTYELGSAKHWCLENDESASERKTIDASLVLFLSHDIYCGEPFLNNPNARLIAAAPDLLDALEELSDWLAYGLDKPDGAEPTEEDLRRCEALAAKARAAVDKAKGVRQ